MKKWLSLLLCLLLAFPSALAETEESEPILAFPDPGLPRSCHAG